MNALALEVLRLFVTFLQQVIALLEAQPEEDVSTVQLTPPGSELPNYSALSLRLTHCAHCRRPPYDSETTVCRYHLTLEERLSRGLLNPRPAQAPEEAATCQHPWHNTSREGRCPHCRCRAGPRVSC